MRGQLSEPRVASGFPNIQFLPYLSLGGRPFGVSIMPYRRLCLLLAALVLSACGQTIATIPAKPVALPTAVVRKAATVALPTPNHQLIDTAILDDLAATAQPTARIPAQPTATAQPTPQA